ncbi:uncharacterized protein LOC129909179 [Episyrphus balteatus]|uniref:uncharacterized protein LOC129909179 n=1 Tax=Episyrphus balteatus TaxID=286459 RepID=UPI002486BE34|nr:uncharacterized protein LOC129909179 [Episyrphus balteatus]
MSKVTRQKQNPNKRLKRDNNKAIEDDFLNKETVTKERSSTTACQKENLEMDTKKSIENENPEQKDVIPQNSLENYRDARKLLRSLRTYIHRIGNNEALLRVHEIDTVLVYVIKNARRYGREV